MSSGNVVSPSTAAGRKPGVRRGRITRLAWTSADQVVSSATNAALSFLVAREVSPSQFGAFAFAFVAFMYAVGVSRALVSDPLIVRFSGVKRSRQKRAIADSAGSAVLVGLAAGAISAALGLMVGDLTGKLLVVLGLLLPGLLLQDHWRQAFFASGRPRSAFVNDALWAVLQLGGVVALIQNDSGGTVAYLAVWGLSACLAAVIGMWQADVLPRVTAGVAWIRDHRDIGLRFTWGFLINQGAFNTAFVIVGGIAGIAAVGAMRAAQVLMGPIRVIFSSIGSFALPLLSRRASGGEPVTRQALAVSASAATVTLAWTGLLLLMSDGVGETLLGATWESAQQVISIFGLQLTAIGVSLGAAMGLKSMAKARLTLRLAIVQAPLALGLGAAGAAWSGAVGAVIGLFITQTIGAAYSWWLFLRWSGQIRVPDTTVSDVEVPR